MKLIDIVIQELPKRGGWPEKAACVVQDADTQICFSAKIDGLSRPGTGWIGGKWDGSWINFFSNHLADDSSTSIITREQYESALAASKKGWNGAFPIPAGTEVEVHFEGDDSRVWTQFRVEYMRGEIVVLYDYRIDSVDAYNNKTLNFRPIHSEADKKRDEVIASIKTMLMYNYGDDPRLNDAIILYEAIAAGKIPHIRID